MNILIIGSGGREHALAWKLAQSPLVDTVHSAPGNPGMDRIGPCFDVAADDVEGLEKLALQIEPDLTVIGPEAPLALGLADRMRARGFDVFGPSAEAAQLEASKGFAKDRMTKYGVPTGRYGRFAEPGAAKAFLRTMTPPYVLKADGLAAGKGVMLPETLEEADAAIDDLLGGRFGGASAEIVIEEFLHGEEASVFILTDGEGAVCLPAAQDHKRAFDGDQGPNTGGMGAYAPAPIVTPEVMERVRLEIAEPMIRGMDADGAPYQGVLYIGLMITPEGPKVVEFNCRFGDPECQVLMAGLAGDIAPALLVCATGGLKTTDVGALLELDRFQPSACVVLASEGYPGEYEKGTEIQGVDAASRLDGVSIFHAGTNVDTSHRLVSAGGRVLSSVGVGETLEQAIDRAYQGVAAIDWPGGFCRSDIGWRVLKRS